MWGHWRHPPPLAYCIFNTKLDTYLFFLTHLYSIIVFTYFIHNTTKNDKTKKDRNNECSMNPC